MDRQPVRRPTEREEEQPGFLFRIYVPSERLYAAEADKLLSLFHDWLTTTRGPGFRQESYRTASGTIYELFASPSASPQADLREQFDTFSDFLNLCDNDPSSATDLLVQPACPRHERRDRG